MASITPADARSPRGFWRPRSSWTRTYAAAHARLAHCHEIFFSHLGFDEAERAAGLRHARFVMASATDDATALAIAAFQISLLSKDHEGASGAIERALSLNPSCAAALYFWRVDLRLQRQTRRRDGTRGPRIAPESIRSLGVSSPYGAWIRVVLEGRYDEAVAPCQSGCKAVQLRRALFQSGYRAGAGRTPGGGEADRSTGT